MTPPFMFRAEPSWDTIDLALPKSATAARAALKHAKKRYEDVLQQLEELVEYEEKHHHHGAAPFSTSSPASSPAPTPQRLRHETEEEMSARRRNEQLAIHRIIYTATFHPVPRNVNSSGECSTFPIAPDDLAPRPTTRLRCGTASFVAPLLSSTIGEDSGENVHTNAKDERQQQQQQRPQQKQQQQQLVNAAENDSASSWRVSISSQRVGSVEHYYYNGILSATSNSNSSKRLLQQQQQQQSESEEKQPAQRQHDEPPQRPAQTEKSPSQPKQHQSPSPRNPSVAGRKRPVVTTTFITADSQPQPRQSRDQRGQEHNYGDNTDEFTANEFDGETKPPRSDSDSPLRYQRRPLHNQSLRHSANNASSSSPSPRGNRRQNAHKKDVFVLSQKQDNNNTSMINQQHRSPTLQRGFSLKRVGSNDDAKSGVVSPSPCQNKKSNRSGISSKREPSLIKGEGVCEAGSSGREAQRANSRSSRSVSARRRNYSVDADDDESVSARARETLLVFGIAGLFVTAALKLKLVEL